jgi:DNA-binding NtrC family response regulator
VIEKEFTISILVIDSDETSRRLLADTLQAFGYEIIQTANIPDGEKVISSGKIDLVMSDLFAPDNRGLEFMRRLKREHPEIPVIILTAQKDDTVIRGIEESGADGVLTKPFRISRVEELIVTILMKFDKAALSPPKSNRKILVVDDDANLIEFMTEALTALGYRVEAHRKITDAAEAVKRDHFDMVISDFMLPDGTGLDLLRQIKKLALGIPFVITTGYPLAYPPAMAKADGVEGYLVKPFRINQMEQVISNLLFPEKSKTKK